VNLLSAPVTLRPGRRPALPPRGASDWLDRLARGRRADELPALVANVHTLCAHGHGLAARLALRAAQADDARPTAAERSALALAVVRDHLLRLAHDWPRLLPAGDGTLLPGGGTLLSDGGGALLPLDGAPPWQAGLDEAQRLARLPGWLQQHWLAEAPGELLAALVADPIDAALAWARRTPTPLARLLARELPPALALCTPHRPLRVPLRVPLRDDQFDHQFDQELNHQCDTQRNTQRDTRRDTQRDTQGDSQRDHQRDHPDGRHRETLGDPLADPLRDHAGSLWAAAPLTLPTQAVPDTGPWCRVHDSAPPHAHNAGMRLIARLLDLLRLAMRGGVDWLWAAGQTLAPGRGRAWVEVGRGLLGYEVTLGTGSSGAPAVLSLRVLSPTDWNLHPEGVLADALAGVRDAASATRLAVAFDPCVPFEIELASAEAHHA
jgi:hypothetical protein